MHIKGGSIDSLFWRNIKYKDIYSNRYSAIKESRKGIKKIYAINYFLLIKFIIM